MLSIDLNSSFIDLTKSDPLQVTSKICFLRSRSTIEFQCWCPEATVQEQKYMQQTHYVITYIGILLLILGKTFQVRFNKILRYLVTTSSKTFESEKQQFLTAKIYEPLFNKERWILRFGAISLLEGLVYWRK